MFDKNEERYEMRTESVMDVLQNNPTIALFSPANFSFELFYLCKVCDFGYATEDLVDEYNHVVNVGAPYIKVKYYEKKAEKRCCSVQIIKTICICPTISSYGPSSKRCFTCW